MVTVAVDFLTVRETEDYSFIPKSEWELRRCFIDLESEGMIAMPTSQLETELKKYIPELEELISVEPTNPLKVYHFYSLDCFRNYVNGEAIVIARNKTDCVKWIQDAWKEDWYLNLEDALEDFNNKMVEIAVEILTTTKLRIYYEPFEGITFVMEGSH